jgi:sulfur-oxidizing protein SoxZ
MAEVKIRIPKVSSGEEVMGRAMVIHPMEIIERDAAGKVVDKIYNYIHTVTVSFNGKEIMKGELTQSVSANPLIAFPLKASAPGTLTVVFEDSTGAKHEGSVKVEF